MSLVWDTDLPPPDKFVLLCLADFADDNGGNVYPSRGAISRKTGHGVSSVYRILASLVQSGLLVVEQAGGGRLTTRYRIDLTRLKMRGHPSQNERGEGAGTPLKTRGVPPQNERAPLSFPQSASLENHHRTINETSEEKKSDEKSSDSLVGEAVVSPQKGAAPPACLKCARGCGDRCGCCCHGEGRLAKSSVEEPENRGGRWKKDGSKRVGSKSAAALPAWFVQWDDLHERYVGGRLSKPAEAVAAIDGLRAKFGPDAALARWEYYLETTEAQFVSIRRFASVPGAYTPPAGWVATGTYRPAEKRKAGANRGMFDVIEERRRRREAAQAAAGGRR